MNERRDDRSENQVSMSAILTHTRELEWFLERWETRDDPEAGLHVRQSVVPAQDAARALWSLAGELVERLRFQAEGFDIQRGTLVPGDEIRQWPDGGVS